MKKDKDFEKKISFNAVVSTMNNLLIWRMVFFIPLYLYIYVLFSLDNAFLLFAMIALILIIPLWALVTHKLLRYLRRRNDYTRFILTKDALHIYDGRTITIDLSEISYIEWRYPSSATETEIRSSKNLCMTGMTIQTPKRYVQIENVSLQSLKFTEGDDPTPRVLQFELMQQLRLQLKRQLGEPKNENSRLTYAGFYTSNLYMGKRKSVDWINLNIAMMIGLPFAPIVVGLIYIFARL